MSSLKDIQYAMNGESNRRSNENEFVPTAKYRPQPPKKDGFVIFKLVRKNRTGGVYLPNTDYAIDPRTVTEEKPHGDGPEMIRLLKGVNTIWVKEQKHLDDRYIKKNARYLEWHGQSNFMRVPAHDVTRLEFMRLSKHNIKNEDRVEGSNIEFFEYDPTEVAKERLQKEQKEMLAIVTANQQPFDKMKKHAFFLKIPLLNELGMPKNEEQLRPDYMLAAKYDPKGYLETLDSPIVETTFLVRSAVIENKIDISRKDGRIQWANGEFICTCPSPDKAIDILVEYALTKTQSANDFIEKLKRSVT
jgi:hypothetical protein